MVNPNVDGYAETLNHRKIHRKTQKTTTSEHQKKAKPEI